MPRWHKILLYRDSWRSIGESVIDDPTYFVSPEGASAPDAELEGTLRIFSEGTPAERQEALCRYPARRKFLEDHFKLIFSDTDPKNESDVCKRYREFSKLMRHDRISLVFSSGHPENPQTFFGNIFLKFHGGKSAEATDKRSVYMVSHRVDTQDSNPIFYPFNVFHGIFNGTLNWIAEEKISTDLINSENRDQWEYELNLNKDEVSYIAASVFELANHKIEYFLLGENGSYLMMALLEIGRPALNLNSNFKQIVIAADATRVIANTPNLLSKVHYHPSSLQKHEDRLNNLSKKERDAFTNLFSQNELMTKKPLGSKLKFESIEDLTPEEKARVLDSALTFYESRGQKYPKQQLARIEKDQDSVAQKRAEIELKPEYAQPHVPEETAPHYAYPSSRIGLGVMRPINSDRNSRTYSLISYRPAQQTSESSLKGMPDGVGIGIMNLEAMFNGKTLNMREVSIVSIDVLPEPKADEKWAKSWAVNLGFRQQCFEGCKQTYASAQYGLAWKLDAAEGRAAVRGSLKFGDDESGALFIEPGISGLLNVELIPLHRWSNSLTLGRQMSLWKAPEWLLTGASNWAWRPAEPWELMGSLELHNQEIQLLARSFYYF